MIQEAWMAAIKAVDSYDARRGVPLGGFASQRIRGAILDYMRSLHWYRHRRQSSAFHPELPLSCANEIADEQADKAREAFHSHHYLAKLMQCLPLTEKHVTQRLLSVQAVQIAAEMGIGEARVSQIRKRAVERMRAAA
jgi:RNA polymerase sigma factor (sigma-70 family)